MDKRVDIWAFGVLLYEMLAGEHAFNGQQLQRLRDLGVVEFLGRGSSRLT